MVLNGISIDELCADTIAKDKSVGSCTVVVGCREPLIVQTSGTAGGDNDCFRLGDEIFAGIIIHQDRTCCLAGFVEQQFDGWCIVDCRNTAVYCFITQYAHDFRAGIVSRRMHAFAGGPAAVSRYHDALFIFIKHYAEVVQPLDGQRPVVDQALQQFRFVGIMAAAQSIKIMNSRRVIFLICCLNAAFCHHRIGIAHSELRHQEHFCTGFIGFDCCGSACAAAADDQDVHIIIDAVEIYFITLDTAVGLQEFCQFCWHLAAFIRSDRKNREAALAVIRMIFLQKSVFFFGAHPWGRHVHSGASCLFNVRHGF